MIASTPITTPLSLALKELWALAWLEGETLGEALKTVRGDWGRRTPGYLSQLKMAAILRQEHEEYAPSQGTISNIENDLFTIMDLQPKVRLSLLKLYPLNDDDIAKLDERFDLDLPLPRKNEYLNNLGSTPPNSAIVWFTDVLNAGAGEVVVVDRETLSEKGVKQEDCQAFKVTDDVLLPDDLRKALPSGTKLVFSPKVKPRLTNLLVYRFGNRYVILEHTEKTAKVPVRNFRDEDGDFVSVTDERLELLGVSIARITPEK